MGDVVDMGGGEAHPLPVRRGLPREVQARIVTLFACFQGVNAIAKAIHEEFGIVLDHRTVGHYDCGKPKARVGRRLRELYASTRERYIGQQAEVGIAHQNHRLRRLERLLDAAERGRDWSAAAKLLELAAKEVGGVLTNVSKVEHKGSVAQVHMSIEDARAELAARLSQVIDGGTLTPAKALEHKDNSPQSDDS